MKIMSLFSKLSITLIEKVLRVISSFVFGVAIVKYLGPDGYGVFSFGLAWFGILSSLAFLGVEHIAIKYFSETAVNFQFLQKSVDRLLFISGIVFAVVSMITAYYFVKSAQEFKVIVFFSFALLIQFAISPSYALQARRRFTLLSKLGILQLILSFILKIVFIYFKIDVVYFGLLYFFDFLLWGILFWVNSTKNDYTKNDGLLNYSIGLLFKKSLPLLLSGVLITVYFKVDQIIIKYFLTNRDLGLFALAIRISEMATLIPLTFLQIIFPNILNSRDNRELQILFDVVVISSILVSTLVCIFSSTIINLVFGADFNDAVVLLRVLIWTILFTSVGQLNFYLIIKDNTQNTVLIKALISLVFNIVLCYVMTAHFGVLGAAISTVISFFFSTILLLLLYKDQRWQLASLFKVFNLFKTYNRFRSLVA